MPSVEIHAFSDEFRDDAARLPEERRSRGRAAESMLPEIDDFRAHLPRGNGVLATLGDELAVAEFDRILWQLQTETPSFSGQNLADEDFEAEWRDTWDEPEAFPHFIAERDGKVIGHVLLYRRPAGDLRVPPDNIDLTHAATLKPVRGSGAGPTFTAHVLRWAHEHGFRSMTTDWRSVNLLSSRFWPRRGWRPTHYRLHRAVP